MNAPVIDRRILRLHLDAIEAAYPLVFVGQLPDGAAFHVEEPNVVSFLAEDRPGLDYISLAQVEIDLTERLGLPVGVLLVGELNARERAAYDGRIVAV
jgi:hypothetical protein